MISSEKIELLKAHCRADDIVDPIDETLLAKYYGAAKVRLLKACNRKEGELLDMGEGEMPEDFETAIMMLAGTLYDQREASAAQAHTIHPFVQGVIDSYSRLSNRREEL